MTYTEEWASAVEVHLRKRLSELDPVSFPVRLVSLERQGSRLRVIVDHYSLSRIVGTTRDIEGWYDSSGHDPAIAADAELWSVVEPPGTAQAIPFNGVLWIGDTATDPMFDEGA